jgi:hypothetical protein
MYFPYFRGRQYELLALKELAKNKLISKSVMPIIEPVKNTSTFTSTLQEFQNVNLPFSIVLNPTVGELKGNIQQVMNLCNFSNKLIIPSLIVKADIPKCLTILKRQNIMHNNLLTILYSRNYLDMYNNEFSSLSPKYTLFSDERQIRRSVKQGKVLFEDKFVKQAKNASYPEDEFFSEDHLYFKEEGYSGFGDYSIIGNEYTESGFAPFAVAIHIVYFANDNSLKIRHFVSDSNDDISDVAGKFYEAVTKLAMWHKNRQKRHITIGLEILLNHYNNKTYPGLPTLKKLSIMHHLELVGKFLDERL